MQVVHIVAIRPHGVKRSGTRTRLRGALCVVSKEKVRMAVYLVWWEESKMAAVLIDQLKGSKSRIDNNL
jgi:hypothetical protein